MTSSNRTPDRDTHGDHTPPVQREPRCPTVLPRVGDRLADGRYEVLEVLGEGGMSSVLGAFDRELERPVALKILHDRGSGAALLDEARILAAAQSPGIVAVYALHLDASPPFLVMERVYGRSLDAQLREAPFAVPDALRVLAGIAKALDVLHARGLAHGDVKAANVLLDRKGAVKLADLGITPLLRRASSGDVVGTPLYMPPERARGLRLSEDVHARGDVYSFAVLAYLLLAGRPPFDETSPHELLRAHASVTPPPLSRVSCLSPAFDAPMARALSKDPLARHASAGELVRDLENAARGADADGRPLRVLVVDDDPDHRELLVRVLSAELAGARVGSAANGAEALGSIAREPPQLLVLDLSMPGMSGITVLERTRAVSPSTRAIVVTGLGSGRERKAAAQLGVHHFLIKPVELPELARCVADCVGRPARARDDTPLA